MPNYAHMKKILLLFVVTIFLNVLLLQAQVLKPGVPEQNHFSSERLQRIDKLVQQYMDSNWISGAIAIVAHDGNIDTGHGRSHEVFPRVGRDAKPLPQARRLTREGRG